MNHLTARFKDAVLEHHRLKELSVQTGKTFISNDFYCLISLTLVKTKLQEAEKLVEIINRERHDSAEAKLDNVLTGIEELLGLIDEALNRRLVRFISWIRHI